MTTNQEIRKQNICTKQGKRKEQEKRVVQWHQKWQSINTTDSPTRAFCSRRWSHSEDRREMEAIRHVQQQQDGGIDR